MAEVIRYVDPDAVGSGSGLDWTNAYTSLNAWESAEQTNLVSAGDWMHVYCRSSSGTADTTTCDIDGWTVDATHYIQIEAASTDYATKDGFDTNKYTVEARLRILENYVNLKGLQFGAQSFNNILTVALAFGTGTCNIDSCYFNSTATSSEDIEITNMTVTNITNCILAGNTGTLDYGIQCLGDDIVNIYNCIITDRSTGILISNVSATVTVKNCAIFNNTDDIDDSASSTIDYNASDDGDGTNSQAPSGGAWTNEFVDPANGDFTAIATGNIQNGIGPSADSNVPVLDIEGDTRSGATAFIGVDEPDVGPPTGIIPNIMYNYRRRRAS